MGTPSADTSIGKVMSTPFKFLTPNMVINRGFTERYFFPKVYPLAGESISAMVRAFSSKDKIVDDLAGGLVLPKIIFGAGVLAKIWVAVDRCPGEMFVWCLVQTETVETEVSPGVFLKQLQILVYSVYCPKQTASNSLFQVDSDDEEAVRQEIIAEHGREAQFNKLLHLHSHGNGRTEASFFDYDQYEVYRGGGDFLITCIVNKKGCLEMTFWAWNQSIFGHQLVIFDCPWTSLSAPHIISDECMFIGEEFAKRVTFDPRLRLDDGSTN